MVYGYCRISTPKQSITRQIRNIQRDFPDAKIIEETYTGRKVQNRPQWSKLVKSLKDGDSIVFDSVSRMSRNASEGIETYFALYDRNIELIFLKEPGINTTTYKQAISESIPKTGTLADYILDGVNAYLKALAKEQIALAFEQSQKEVDDLSQRTREGVETARRAGKQIGRASGASVTTRKALQSKITIIQQNRDFLGTLDDTQSMKLAEISRGSFYKYKQEITSDLETKSPDDLLKDLKSALKAKPKQKTKRE